MAKHLRELLEEKNRRAAQTPAWRQIVHHDHPAPIRAAQVPEPGSAAPSSEQDPVASVPASRDRGGD